MDICNSLVQGILMCAIITQPAHSPVMIMKRVPSSRNSLLGTYDQATVQ